MWIFDASQTPRPDNVLTSQEAMKTHDCLLNERVFHNPPAPLRNCFGPFSQTPFPKVSCGHATRPYVRMGLFTSKSGQTLCGRRAYSRERYRLTHTHIAPIYGPHPSGPFSSATSRRSIQRCTVGSCAGGSTMRTNAAKRRIPPRMSAFVGSKKHSAAYVASPFTQRSTSFRHKTLRIRGQCASRLAMTLAREAQAIKWKCCPAVRNSQDVIFLWSLRTRHHSRVRCMLRTNASSVHIFPKYFSAFCRLALDLACKQR